MNLPTRSVISIRPLAFAAAVGAVVACNDSIGPRATLDVRTDSAFSVYAINGAPPGAATAVHLYSGVPIRAGATFQFDVAFDVNAEGRVVIHTVRALAGGLAPAHRVGLQAMEQPFGLIDRAPPSGYQYDSTIVVPVGTVVAMESTDQIVCAIGVFFINPVISAKVVIDAVLTDPDNPNIRRLAGRYTVNPNCGFRSFLPGRPQD